jgi:hypothetical protein
MLNKHIISSIKVAKLRYLRESVGKTRKDWQRNVQIRKNLGQNNLQLILLKEKN